MVSGYKMAISGYFAHVNARIDPILIATVSISPRDVYSMSKRRDRLEQFLGKLTNGKPVEYYGRHIKNLAIHGTSSQNEATINRMLAICTGVENLVLSTPARYFFENPQAGRHLRRLSIKLDQAFFQQFGSKLNFYHPCFSNLTHLHLWDREYNWPMFAGWESLTRLTHLAFACAVPGDVMRLLQKLPTVQYVAIGHYDNSERYRYADATVNHSPDTKAAWGVRVVLFPEIPQNDWERGARGEGDFWNLVEREVKRRLKEGLVD
jgi:hypothetical protein